MNGLAMGVLPRLDLNDLVLLLDLLFQEVETLENFFVCFGKLLKLLLQGSRPAQPLPHLGKTYFTR